MCLSSSVPNSGKGLPCRALVRGKYPMKIKICRIVVSGNFFEKPNFKKHRAMGFIQGGYASITQIVDSQHRMISATILSSRMVLTLRSRIKQNALTTCF